MPALIRRPYSLVLVVAALVVGVTACTSSAPPQEQAATQFLNALGSGNAKQAAALTDEPKQAQTNIAATITGLGTGAKGALKVTGQSGVQASSATVKFSASWTIAGSAKKFTYDGSLPMVKTNGKWLVDWTPRAVNPQLSDGQSLLVQRTQPTRASLEDRNGTALFTETPVVEVGIQPNEVTDLPTLSATLAQLLSISAADITSSVQAAKPTDFVPVITIRESFYESIKAQIHDLPGTVFRSDNAILPPASGWGEPLLGNVGPATAQVIKESKGRVQVGDITGLSGLQLTYDKQLAGSPGLIVYAADSSGNTVKPLETLQAPKAGTPVKLTLDSSAQTAAQTALQSITLPAAVVALQPSTGQILAVANSSAATSDIAVDGQFPPGSDFKIVTYSAAFGADPSLTPTTPAACPGTVTVNGKVFQNENAFDKGMINIRDAFAYSCNTTAINFGTKLTADALPKTATGLGLGIKWNLPMPAFSGSVPTSTSPTDLAADSIGQGTVLVSPLSMASVVGAAASGTPVPPSLLFGQQAPAGAALSPTVTADMNTLMQAVVQQPFGTAHALASLPGSVQGKTGTAQFGTAVPPQSHSWMVGTRGDLAFAVFVYGGEASTTTAVPIASSFLTAYPPA